MIDFFSKDFISLLAAVLLFGGIILLILVIKNFIKGENKNEGTASEQIKPEQPTTYTVKTKTTVAPVPQTTLSQELTAVKTQLQELAAVKNQLNDIFKFLQSQPNNDFLKEELDKINHKLDMLCGFLSNK